MKDTKGGADRGVDGHGGAGGAGMGIGAGIDSVITPAADHPTLVIQKISRFFS